MPLSQTNSNSDTAFLLDIPQDSAAAILKELRIIAMLLREGFNLPDEDSSLSQQPVPALNPSIIVTTVP